MVQISPRRVCLHWNLVKCFNGLQSFCKGSSKMQNNKASRIWNPVKCSNWSLCVRQWGQNQNPDLLLFISFMTPLHHPHCKLSSSNPQSSLLTLPAYFTHLSAPAVCWWVVVHIICTQRPAWGNDHSRALTCAGAAPWLPPPNAYPFNRHANSLGIKNITGTHTYRNTANRYTATYTAINTDTLLNTHWAIYTGLAAHTSQLKASQRVCACVCVCAYEKREWHFQGPPFSDLLVLRLPRWCGCYLLVAFVVRGMDYGPSSLILLSSQGSSVL